MYADPLLEKIEKLKDAGNLDEALKIANQLLSKDPKNKNALFQIADIEYRRGEIARAEKPIDFLLQGADDDAMSLYIKGVLEMEKTNRQQAKSYFMRALKIIKEENPEIMRCYGLCEYWLGHREDGIEYLNRAYSSNPHDAEILLNLIEISIMEENRKDAKHYISCYQKDKEKIQYFDRSSEYYDEKIGMFDTYIKNHLETL